MSRLLSHPDLDWHGNTPRSIQFADIYRSVDGAWDEALQVFCRGCGLPDSWCGRTRPFVIGELGFGFGVNALAVWDLWRTERSRDHHRDLAPALEFVSVEGFPVSRDDLARGLAAYGAPADLAARLVDVWPPPVQGVHRLAFPDDRFTITLVFDDVMAGLDQITAPVNGWFLDGFAPAKNADMWSETVLRRMAALSVPGTKLASYSSARKVRDGLSAVGFTPIIKPGFGRKRDRLEAVFAADSEPEPDGAVWPGEAIVIGAGIMGANVAAALASYGIQVRVIDTAAGPGFGASGNPVGMVSPRIDLGDGFGASVHLRGFLAATRCYQQLNQPADPPIWQPIGVWRAEPDPARRARLTEDPPLPATDLMIDDETGGLWLGSSGVLHNRAAIDALLAQAICHFGHRVSRIDALSSGYSRVYDEDGAAIHEAPLVFLCTADDAPRFVPELAPSIHRRAGQLDWTSLDAAETSPTAPFARSDGGYVLALDNTLYCGATFEPLTPGAPPPPVTSAASAHNRDVVTRLAPALASVDWSQGEARVGVRATTPDHLPIVGPVPDFAAADQAYRRSLQSGTAMPPLPTRTGLFVATGLGARGLTFAPLMAALVVAQALGTPLPVSPAEAAALDPQRFWRRALRRTPIGGA